MNAVDIITEIEAGHHDAYLQQIQVALALRMQAKNRAAQMPRTSNGVINVGTRVRINNTAATGYVRGLAATVVDKKRSRIVIQLDAGPIGRFSTGRITVPTSLVDVI